MPTGSNLQTFIFCSRVSSFNVRVFLVSVTDYYIKRETDGRDKYRKNMSENLKERDHLEDLRKDDRALLKWILKK